MRFCPSINRIVSSIRPFFFITFPPYRYDFFVLLLETVTARWCVTLVFVILYRTVYIQLYKGNISIHKRVYSSYIILHSDISYNIYTTRQLRIIVITNLRHLNIAINGIL